ncbi:PLDc N-terminal domain-containing protein [Arthrobacter sp.]|uniref:PLDc N-terminal domain-containing protein n=1 Tax=Arthrobacter sp. TaxID=1667 RepID=UPI003A8E2C36
MAAKKRFKDLGTGGKIGVTLLGAAQVALQGAALKDLKGRPAAQVKGPKLMWFAVSFMNFGGPIAYFLIGRKK